MRGIRIRNSDISLSVIAFSILVFFMLFDTNTYYLGSLTAFIACATVIISALFEAEKRWVHYSIRLGHFSIALFISLSLISILSMQIETGIMNIAEIALLSGVAVVLSSRCYTEQEVLYIGDAIIVTTLFYTLWFLVSAQNYQLSVVRKTLYVLGSAIDPNFLGSSLVCGTLLLLDRIFIEKKLRLVCAVALTTIIYAIVLTASRTAYVTAGFVIGSRVLIEIRTIRNTKKQLMFTILVISAVLFFASFAYGIAPNNINRMVDFDLGDGGNGRLELWRRALRNWYEKPILGIGFGATFNPQLPISASNIASHNTLLKLLSETGLLGTAIFIVFIRSLITPSKGMRAMQMLIVLTILIPSLLLDMLDSKVFWVIISYASLIGNVGISRT